MNTLKLIDHALDAAKAAAHSCRTETAQLHYEYALALIRESWLAESGQNARTAQQIIGDVDQGMAIIQRIIVTCPQRPPLECES